MVRCLKNGYIGNLNSLGDSPYVGGGTHKKDILSLRTMNAMDDFLFMPKTTSGYRRKEKEFHVTNVTIHDARNHHRIVGS